MVEVEVTKHFYRTVSWGAVIEFTLIKIDRFRVKLVVRQKVT